MTDRDITATCGQCIQVFVQQNNLRCNISKKYLKEMAIGECPKANDKSKKLVNSKT